MPPNYCALLCGISREDRCIRRGEAIGARRQLDSRVKFKDEIVPVEIPQRKVILFSSRRMKSP